MHQKRRKDVRNLAIVAHVDHGKTTLVDAILKQTGAHEFKEGENTVMDSNPLERERGITIFSKNASLIYKDTVFNIVDTPGHADFGSEVERILRMVDGVLLLVDAFDGPMPQTKFVLRKCLDLHLKPILVVNKVDRPNARPEEVVNLAFDLFCELNATDEQLDFPIVYASAKEGWATLELDDSRQDMKPLLDTIHHRVLPPVADPDLPFQMLVTMLEYDDYVGRIAVGRVFHGRVRVSDMLALVKRGGTVEKGKVTKIMKYKGLKKVEAEEAMAGDIISLAGIENVHVADTLASVENPEPLPAIHIDEPTISMTFAHNSSPLAGKDGGRFLTSRHVRERLEHEAMINVGIKMEPVPGASERFKVSGRGELHLSILIETMRREGYELEVSRPQVILKTIDGEVYEPFEEVVIEVAPEFQGTVIELMGKRKTEMKNMYTSAVGTVRMEYLTPSRALIGLRSDLLQLTRGTAVLNQIFYDYLPYSGEIEEAPHGVLISQGGGTATAYALWGLQERGEIFIRPGDEMYEGMVIGVNNKGHDLVVNAEREKKLTNMRASGSDEAIMLTPPREMTLEFALEFIADDEMVEVTPKNIRLRKFYLDENTRKRMKK